MPPRPPGRPAPKMRTFRVDPDVRARATAKAHANGEYLTEVVERLLRRYANRPVTGIREHVPRNRVEGGRPSVKVSLRLTDDVWDPALARAEAAGEPLADALNDSLRRYAASP